MLNNPEITKKTVMDITNELVPLFIPEDYISDIMDDANNSDILNAPDIAKEITDFENCNDILEAFIHGLKIGISVGARFGILSTVETFAKSFSNATSPEIQSLIEGVSEDSED